MDAEKICIGAATLSTGTTGGLTQMFQIVFAVLVHVHCSLKTVPLLALVASRCQFVGSFHVPEKTAQLGDHEVSFAQSAFCLCLFRWLTLV